MDKQESAHYNKYKELYKKLDEPNLDFFMPLTRKQIKEMLDNDNYHLNGNLKEWDYKANFVSHFHEGKALSLSERVCLLKWYARNVFVKQLIYHDVDLI